MRKDHHTITVTNQAILAPSGSRTHDPRMKMP